MGYFAPSAIMVPRMDMVSGVSDATVSKPTDRPLHPKSIGTTAVPTVAVKLVPCLASVMVHLTS